MKTKRFLFQMMILMLFFTAISCTQEDPKPEVKASDFVISIAENPQMNQYVGKIDIQVWEADNSNAHFYLTGQSELNNNITIDYAGGDIFITNPSYFDFEQRASITTTGAVEVFNSSDEMATATFTITINLTDISEVVPTLQTMTVTNITANTAHTGGNVSDDGNSAIIERGIVWSSVNTNPTIADSKQSSGQGLGSFEVSVYSLTSNTTYYVRSYATNSTGTGYGNVQTFTTQLVVGDSYQGGIVAYLLQSGDVGYNVNIQHGIIAAIVDQSTSVPWSLTLTTIGTTSQNIGSGQSNTTTIISNQGNGTYAAKICSDLDFGGYDDWYLPSLYELNKLYLNKNVIGEFAVGFYWSSSEENSNGAWLQSLNSDSQTVGSKTNNYYVRAVRSF